MGIFKEFQDFAMRGNVVDLAVGVVIGGAFGGIVKSLVDDIIMPLTGLLTGGVDFSGMAYEIQVPEEVRKAVEEVGGTVEPAQVGYGNFIQSMFTFLIIAVAIFAVVKAMNTVQAKLTAEAEEKKEPAAVPKDIALLTEIRDALVAEKS
ncbi:MAG: large-conductance mechanosensitive channel protein MscL [Planctomycetota bacterium]